VWNIKNLWFRYREELPWTIRGLNLDIREGGFTGILGPNGCGKTTFLDLLSGMIKPERGGIMFKNEPIARWKTGDLSRHVAMVPQDFSIRFAFTVRQVVEMGRFPFLKRLGGMNLEDHRIVGRVMEELGIASLADRPVTTLSGGELQRVAVARALAQTPETLLLDEATSNLDVYHSLSIMSVIKQKVEEEGLTVIAAIHDINLAAAFCTDAVFMDRGEIKACGPRDELLKGELISRVYGVEAAVCRDGFGSGVQISFRLPG
jgi:iron complex transport system ATP-binding protein